MVAAILTALLVAPAALAASSSGPGQQQASQQQAPQQQAPAAQQAPAPAPQVSPITATVAAVSGQVLVQRAGKELWEPATVGMELAQGDSILTWDGSYAVLTILNTDRLELGPRTQIRLGEMGVTPTEKRSRIRLLAGKLWSTVRSLVGRESKFEVESESAVAAVRGTDFYTEFGPGGFQVKVQDGRVEVSAGGKTVVLGSGQGTRVPTGAGAQPEDPSPAGEYPKPPSEGGAGEQGQAPAQRPAPAPTPPPSAPAPAVPASGEGWALSVGQHIVGDIGLVAVGLEPEFQLGPVGLGLDLTLYYSPKDDRIGLFYDPETGKILPKPGSDFKEIVPLLPGLFRWVAFETEPFGVRWGRLSGLRLGEGILVNGYSLADETGLRLRADLGLLGGTVLVPTNPKTNLMAGRLFLRPAPSLPFELGVTAASERSAVPGRNPEAAQLGLATDAIYRLSPLLTLYAQAATMVKNPIGAGEVAAAAETPAEAARIGMSAGAAGALGPLTYRAEFRRTNGFTFGYFDGSYERIRLSGGAPQMFSQPLTGFLATADLQLPLLRGVYAGASYENYQGYADRLQASAGITLPNSLEASIQYSQYGIQWDKFEWYNENTAVYSRVKYPIRSGILIVVEREQYFGSRANQSSLNVRTEFRL